MQTSTSPSAVISELLYHFRPISRSVGYLLDFIQFRKVIHLRVSACKSSCFVPLLLNPQTVPETRQFSADVMYPEIGKIHWLYCLSGLAGQARPR